MGIDILGLSPVQVLEKIGSEGFIDDLVYLLQKKPPNRCGRAAAGALCFGSCREKQCDPALTDVFKFVAENDGYPHLRDRAKRIVESGCSCSSKRRINGVEAQG